MDQNRRFSDEVYQVENGNLVVGDRINRNENYIVINTIDTDKNIIGTETKPKKNSKQAMVVAEIKDEFKKLSDNELRKVPGFPDSVITKNLTIAYAGMTSLKDWHTNLEEIGERNQRL